jgi:glutamine synthetase
MATVRAVHVRAGLLRAAIASAGNDHRLGANEAPPAIISVYLGDQLTRILDSIERQVEEHGPAEERIIRLGLSNLPDIDQDYTDRNRTSPFAFTGNKFEFRAVGSSAAVAHPITVLNAAVAESLELVHDRIVQRMGGGAPLDQAVLDVVRELIGETRAIRFEGNNYAPEWVEEAQRRGLLNLARSPEALEQFVRPEAIELFTRTGTFTAEEVKARYHVYLERYLKDVDIEVDALLDLVRTHILPAALQHQTLVGHAIEAVQRVKGGHVPAGEMELLDACLEEVRKLRERTDGLAARVRDLGGMDEHARAARYAYDVVPAMKAVREACDRLEEMIADPLWPLPKYTEMLFLS